MSKDVYDDLEAGLKKTELKKPPPRLNPPPPPNEMDTGPFIENHPLHPYIYPLSLYANVSKTKIII